jgi:hypothetical protein
MPLQIRRGPTADRLTITPLAGELVYDTTTGAVFVGNGTTAGGVPVTAFGVSDAYPATGRVFLGGIVGGAVGTDNSIHSGITFQYDTGTSRLIATVNQDLSNYVGLINADQGFQGSLWADDSTLVMDSETGTLYGRHVGILVGSVYTEGSTQLVNAEDGTINLDGTIAAGITPTTTSVFDIGSSAYKFRSLYVSSGINIGSAVITGAGATVDLPANSTVGGAPLGIASGSTYTINIVGSVVGELSGSVFADDSSGPLVNAVDASINLDGTVKGNIVPDVSETRNLGTFTSKFNRLYLKDGANLYLGNAVIGSQTTYIELPANSTVGGVPISALSPGASYNIGVTANDSTAIIDPSLKTVTATGGFTGALTGNSTGTHFGQVFGNVRGDVIGSIFGEDSSMMVDATSNQFVGDITGSVKSPDSTVIINASTKQIGYVSASLVGNLTGNVTGNITGNVLDSGANLIVNVATKKALLAEVAASGTSSSLTISGSSTTFTTPSNTFFLTSVTSSPLVNLVTVNNSTAEAGSLTLTRTRGSLGAYAVVQNNDELGKITWSGYDGGISPGGFDLVANITGLVDGSPAGGLIPTRIEIAVNNSAGTSVTPVKVKATKVEFTVAPQLPIYANDAARLAAIATPDQGMMVFMQSGTTPAATNKVQVYDGSAWVNLH